MANATPANKPTPSKDAQKKAAQDAGKFGPRTEKVTGDWGGKKTTQTLTVR